MQSGTAKDCNFGFCKYWDSNNNDFVIEGFEATWLGGAADADPNISLIHHSATGWTYNGGPGGNVPLPPTPVASMQADHVGDKLLASGVHGAWKRANLFEVVAGGSSEGTIIQLDTNAGRTFAIGNFLLRVRTR